MLCQKPLTSGRQRDRQHAYQTLEHRSMLRLERGLCNRLELPNMEDIG